MAKLVTSDRKVVLGLLLILSVILFYRLQNAWPTRQVRTTSDSWTFDAAVDERNFGLSEQQCDSSFPGLWYEIDRVVQYRHQQGNITFEDVEKSDGGEDTLRILIYDRQVGTLQPNHFILHLAN